MKKRFLVLLLTIVSILTLTSCSKKYTVSFDLNGGTGDVASQEVKKGSTASKPTDPTKAGYSFEGWYNGNTEFKFSDSITEDITLTAHWKQNKYTVTFDTDGGSAVASQDVAHGSKATNQTTTKAGFTFVEWQLNGQTYDFNTAVTANITLKAKWEVDANAEIVTITFNAAGGVLTSTTLTILKGGHAASLPQPTRDGYSFDGWYVGDVEFTTSTVVNEDITVTAKWTSSSNVYTPKWDANQRTGGWTGNGMTFKILVKPVSSFDPFCSTGYTGTNTKIKQNQQRKVMSAYDIVIKYEEWSSAWGPDRITDIKNSIGSSWEYDDTLDSEGVAKGGVYVISIASSWIPTLAKTSCLAPLYNTLTETGIFAEVGYEETYDKDGNITYVPGTYQQHETINQVTSVSNVVYGYTQGNPHPDHFLYYNADMIKEAGMEDPAELWFKGQWTWDTFTTYCAALQNSLSGNEKALAVGYPEFFIGANAAYGNPIATSSPQLNLCSNTTYEVLNKIKNLYNSGYYGTVGGDVPASFLIQESVFVSGSLWFLNDATRFDPAKCTFTIGAVPYPASSGNGGTPITTTDSDSDELIYGRDGEPLETEEGDYIIGLDLSDSNLKIPYTSTECYSVVNFSNGKNGITPKIAFAIIYDLNSGLGDDPDEFKVSTEQAYRNVLMKKFNNNSLYVDTLMSVDDRTYFELIEILSMTVGNGSHYQGNALWTANGISAIITQATVTPADQLSAIEQDYVDAMRGMGYMV